MDWQTPQRPALSEAPYTSPAGLALGVENLGLMVVEAREGAAASCVMSVVKLANWGERSRLRSTQEKLSIFKVHMNGPDFSFSRVLGGLLCVPLCWLHPDSCPGSSETGILLPNNQRQHRTSHAPKDALS